MHARAHTHARARAHTHTRTHTHANTHRHTYILRLINTHRHRHRHTDTDTHTHTHTHTHTNAEIRTFLYCFPASAASKELWNRHQIPIHRSHRNRHQRIHSSKSTSSDRFILFVIVWKIKRFWRRSGSGNSIFRSSRPGRSNAGSSVSARFVAMITCSEKRRQEGKPGRGY